MHISQNKVTGTQKKRLEENAPKCPMTLDRWRHSGGLFCIFITVLKPFLTPDGTEPSELVPRDTHAVVVPTLSRGRVGYCGDAEGRCLTRASGVPCRLRPRAELELEQAGGSGCRQPRKLAG